jgi:hypothetical protein
MARPVALFIEASGKTHALHGWDESEPPIFERPYAGMQVAWHLKLPALGRRVVTRRAKTSTPSTRVK